MGPKRSGMVAKRTDERWDGALEKKEAAWNLKTMAMHSGNNNGRADNEPVRRQVNETRRGLSSPYGSSCLTWAARISRDKLCESALNETFEYALRAK